MIAALLALACLPLCIAVTWVLFMAVMNLAHARDAGTLTPAALRMGKVILAVGLVCDFLCNMIPVSILFAELPREWLVTSRVQRHANATSGWRRNIAIWFAVNMLNPFDLTGDHIKLK